MNVLIPLAGNIVKDSHGYSKLLYEFNGKVLIHYIIEKILSNFDKDKIIVVLGHNTDNNLERIIRLISKEIIIIRASGETLGPLSTSMLAIDLVDEKNELVIINGDQIINRDIAAIIDDFIKSDWDGGLITFESYHPRWSFIKFEGSIVLKTAEKTPISNQASAGVYYFKNSKSFFESASKVFLKENNHAGKYFIAETYNEMILNNLKVTFTTIERSDYIKLSTEDDFNKFSDFVKGDLV